MLCLPVAVVTLHPVRSGFGDEHRVGLFHRWELVAIHLHEVVRVDKNAVFGLVSEGGRPALDQLQHLLFDLILRALDDEVLQVVHEVLGGDLLMELNVNGCQLCLSSLLGISKKRLNNRLVP